MVEFKSEKRDVNLLRPQCISMEEEESIKKMFKVTVQVRPDQNPRYMDVIQVT